MNRIPPALLYLTIYNPTIRPPVSTVSEDDEDAEEQAQILFYTSRHQAVSRDKMLRQIGLAKALVHFAEIFHSTGPYQNVHSQSKHMIMLSPEPNFWMHAAIELARTEQVPQTKSKGKGKAKEMSGQDAPLPPEYHDNSLHDSAIRAHLFRGYEAFKISHGSFTSILSSLGQRALESQLERFFTLWAWSWNLEGSSNLVEDLGLPLHPLYRTILPAIDTFSSSLPDGLLAIVLTPEYIAPSSAYRDKHYPTALGRQLMILVSRTCNEASTTQPHPTPSQDVSDPQTNGTLPTAETQTSNGFLGIPSVAMDIRKWSWPGGFSLNRSPDTNPGSSTPAEPCSLPKSVTDGPISQCDRSALEDAMSTNSFGSGEKEETVHESVVPSINEEDFHEDVDLQGPSLPDVDTPRPSRSPSPTSPPLEMASNSHQPNGDSEMLPLETATSSLQASGDNEMPYNTYFTSTTVFIAPNDDPLATVGHTIFLLKGNRITVALLNGDPNDVEALGPPASRLCEEINETIAEDAKRIPSSSLPSVSTILQPRDSHVLKVQDYVIGGTGFASSTGHFYDAKELLEKQSDMVEVFSRSLNPQHWHAIHRGNERGEMYLQVSRKETSLSDVDNILQKLYKNYIK